MRRPALPALGSFKDAAVWLSALLQKRKPQFHEGIEVKSCHNLFPYLVYNQHNEVHPKLCFSPLTTKDSVGYLDTGHIPMPTQMTFPGNTSTLLLKQERSFRSWEKAKVHRQASRSSDTLQQKKCFQ